MFFLKYIIDYTFNYIYDIGKIKSMLIFFCVCNVNIVTNIVIYIMLQIILFKFFYFFHSFIIDTFYLYIRNLLELRIKLEMYKIQKSVMFNNMFVAFV